MILHFIIDKKHGESFINYINQNFNIDEHFFVLIGSKTFNVPETTRRITVSKKDFIIKMIHLLKLMSEADVIIVHYLALVELYFFMLFAKRNLKKIKWIMFGGDIYGNEYNKIQLKLLKSFFRKINGVCYLLEEDYKYIVTKYHVEPNRYKINYAFTDPEYYIRIFKEGLSSYNQKELSVIVGNSASEENNHEEMFKFLSKIPNLHVFCPLSYGDKNYAEKIIEKGKIIFGDRFHPITEFISYEEYLIMLCKMSFGVYGYKRQQGLGNVRPLIFMGKKIFLIKDTPMYNHFKKDFSNQVYDICELEKIDISQLAKTEGIQEGYIRKLYNIENNKGLWTNLFINK